MMDPRLETLADWCVDYGGSVRTTRDSVECRFDQGTFLEVTRQPSGRLRGEAEASLDGSPEYITGGATVQEEHGLVEVSVGGYNLEPRGGVGGGSTLAAFRSRMP